MRKKDANELLGKYRAGNLTEEERILLLNWFHQFGAEQPTDLSEEDLLNAQQSMWPSIALKTMQTRKRRPLWHSISAAAIVLIAVTAGFYFYQQQHAGSPSKNTAFVNDVAPGGDKAILTLADGKKIVLDAATEGQIADQSGIKISKNAKGQLVYVLAGSDTKPGETKLTYNTIETPKGGQYQLILADGTKVWLNAASSLKYPTKFSGSERKVELIGEGYFEVAHDRSKPFKVKTVQQDLEVLGTHFNISAYHDEAAVKTTLLEGAVKVYQHTAPGNNATKPVYLKPGQQSALTKERIEVNDIDAESEVDWKDGYFIFKQEDLSSIMKKIARWYDLEVIYLKPPGNQTFGGTVSRSRGLKEVLRMLTISGGAKFEVSGRRVTVMP